MRTGAKRFLESIAPPLLWNLGKQVKRRLLRSVDHFAYAPAGWATPLPAGATSDDFWSALAARERTACEAIIARARSREPRWPLNGDVKDVLFAYALALTARQGGPITLLDYGGNLGDSYWLAEALVPEANLTYHCKELPAVAAAGRRMTPGATWHTDDGCLAQPHDLVVFSSCLQCLPEWQDILGRAARSARSYLLLTDVPTVRDVPSYVVTQRYAGMTNLQYHLNHAEVVTTVERAGWRLLREVNMGMHPPVEHAPEQPARLGFLFERVRDAAGRGDESPAS